MDRLSAIKSGHVDSDNECMESPAARMRPTVRADRGSIIFGWLTRLTLTLTVLGIICFEVLSIVVARFSLEDNGMEAGAAAVTSYQAYGNPRLALAAADAVAEQYGATIVKKTFRVNPDASVSFEIRNTATTIVLFRVSPLAHLAEVQTTIFAEPIESSGSQP
jgi:hypothetical protein